MRGKLSENLIPLVLAPFVFMSLFGIGIGMDMKDGQMSSCPFMASQASVCQMSVTEHIGQWQQAFLGVPANSSVLILALLLLAFVAVPFAKRKRTEFKKYARKKIRMKRIPSFDFDIDTEKNIIY